MGVGAAVEVLLVLAGLRWAPGLCGRAPVRGDVEGQVVIRAVLRSDNWQNRLEIACGLMTCVLRDEMVMSKLRIILHSTVFCVHGSVSVSDGWYDKYHIMIWFDFYNTRYASLYKIILGHYNTVVLPLKY